MFLNILLWFLLQWPLSTFISNHFYLLMHWPVAAWWTYYPLCTHRFAHINEIPLKIPNISSVWTIFCCRKNNENYFLQKYFQHLASLPVEILTVLYVNNIISLMENLERTRQVCVSFSVSFNNKFLCTYKFSLSTLNWEHTQEEKKDGKMSVQTSLLTLYNGWEIKGGAHNSLAKSKYVWNQRNWRNCLCLWSLKCDLNPER